MPTPPRPPSEREPIERPIEEQLAVTRAELKQLQLQRADIQTRLDASQQELLQARTEAASATAVTEELRRTQARLDSEVDQLRAQLEDVRAGLREQEGELGRLRSIADTVGTMQAERDAAREQLRSMEGTIERQVSDAVRTALDETEARHRAEQASWSQERAQLNARIEELERLRAEAGVTGRVAPTDLASRFASVLRDLAEPEPAEGSAFTAALTSLEVEARGLLEAPHEDEAEPRFTTVEAGGVDPEQLSTMRMTFRLLPRTGAEIRRPEA